MKVSMTIAALMLSTVSVSAFAGGTTKQALQVDFNRMIEDNNSHRAEMRKDINAKAHALDEAEHKAEKEKVINFVDVEVGWGEAPPIVDRRYDSVGEARVYNLNEGDLENHGS